MTEVLKRRDRGAGGRESYHESSSTRHCSRGDHAFQCMVCVYLPLRAAGLTPQDLDYRVDSAALGLCQES